MPPRTAAALIIGNALLTGKIQEGNLAFLGQELFRLGIVRDGWRALAMLRRAAPALADWARARTLH